MARGSFFKTLLLVAMALLFTACGPEDEAPQKHSQNTAKVGAKLPARPNIDAILKAPRTLPDGSLTVTGLILDRAQHFGTDVRVRGIVREASPDCPFLTDPKEKENRPKKGEERRTCKSVFVTIADSPIAPKELLLVDYNDYFHPYLQPGTEVIALGKYDTQGFGFVRPRDGLLIVSDFVNMAIDAEGNFANDPETVAKMKAEAAAPPR